MEHTTFAKKTVVLAALGALSLMAATVRAANETDTPSTPDPKPITVTIGQEGALGIDSTITDQEMKWDTEWLQ